MEDRSKERLLLIEERRRRLGKLQPRADWTADELREFQARVDRLIKRLEESNRIAGAG